VLGNVGQRFLRDVENGQRFAVGHAGEAVGGPLQADRDERVGLELVHQALNALHQIFVVQLARAQVEDVGADVADGAVEVGDGLVDALVRAVHVFVQQQAGMFQRQADGVNRLDDAVVQVHADALALFEDGQALALQVEAQVFNGGAQPGADGGQVLGFQFVQRLVMAGGNDEHAQRAAPPGERHAGQVAQAGVGHGRVERGELLIRQGEQARLVVARGGADDILADQHLVLLPQAVDEHALVVHQLQQLAVFAPQEHLAHFQAQVAEQLPQALAHDQVDVVRGGHGGGHGVEQRQVFVAAGQHAVALDQLAVQARVGDGHRGIRGQHFNDQLVGVGEFIPVGFIGQVNLPEGFVAQADGHAQQRLHRRVVRRETRAARIVADVGDAQRRFGAHQHADQAAANRRVGHAGQFGRAHADGDELLQLAVDAQHAHRGVARFGLLAGQRGNAFEQRFERNVAHQVQAGAVQRHEALFELFLGQRAHRIKWHDLILPVTSTFVKKGRAGDV
jgi:hypothetical protein